MVRLKSAVTRSTSSENGGSSRAGKPAKASGSDGFCNPPNLVLCQIGHLCCQASSGENFRDKFHGLALFLAPDYTPGHRDVIPAVQMCDVRDHHI